MMNRFPASSKREDDRLYDPSESTTEGDPRRSGAVVEASRFQAAADRPSSLLYLQQQQQEQQRMGDLLATKQNAMDLQLRRQELEHEIRAVELRRDRLQTEMLLRKSYRPGANLLGSHIPSYPTTFQPRDRDNEVYHQEREQLLLRQSLMDRRGAEAARFHNIGALERLRREAELERQHAVTSLHKNNNSARFQAERHYLEPAAAGVAKKKRNVPKTPTVATNSPHHKQHAEPITEKELLVRKERVEKEMSRSLELERSRNASRRRNKPKFFKTPEEEGLTQEEWDQQMGRVRKKQRNSAGLEEEEVEESSGGVTFPLHLDIDKDHVSPYQQIVRQSLEFFQTAPGDVFSNIHGRNHEIRVGQIGVRCKYCSHRPVHWRGRGCLYFPSRLSGVYQAAQNVANNHLADACRDLPEDVKQKLDNLRGRSSARRGGGKKYWEDACRGLGLYEREGDPGVWLR